MKGIALIAFLAGATCGFSQQSASREPAAQAVSTQNERPEEQEELRQSVLQAGTKAIRIEKNTVSQTEERPAEQSMPAASAARKENP